MVSGAFVTSRTLNTDWTSLTVSVNSDISGEAGALAALPDKRRVGRRGGGGGGCHDGRKQMRSRS